MIYCCSSIHYEPEKKKKEHHSTLHSWQNTLHNVDQNELGPLQLWDGLLLDNQMETGDQWRNVGITIGRARWRSQPSLGMLGPNQHAIKWDETSIVDHARRPDEILLKEAEHIWWTPQMGWAGSTRVLDCCSQEYWKAWSTTVNFKPHPLMCWCERFWMVGLHV